MTELSRYHRVHKFSNGATLLYYKHNINNTTKFYVGYLSGASQDKIPGTAHFLEHMLFIETPTLSRMEKSALLKDYDVDYNAFTTRDYVLLYGDTPNRFIDNVLEIYSDCLFNKNFKIESINLERMAIEEEVNMVSGNNKEDDFIDLSYSQIAVPKKECNLTGTKEDIAKINKEVLQEYFDRVFVSENMIISVVSNLEFDEIKEKFEKMFVNKAKSDKTKKVKYEKTNYYFPSNYISKIKDSNQKTVQVNVAFMSRKPERETHLFSYVENYIFNGFSGRLMKEIRLKRGLAYATNYASLLFPNNMSLNSFMTLTSKKKVNETIETLGQIITDIARNGITQEELDACKEMILAREEDRKNGLKTIDPLKILNRYLEGTEVFFNNQIHKVKELTLDQVNKYLRDTYTNSNLIVYIDGDLPKDCYDTYQIQKILNAKLSQVYFNTLDNNFYDYQTKEKLTEKQAMEKLSGLSEQEKFSNLAYVQDYDANEMAVLQQKMLLLSIPVDQRVKIANDYLKTLGFNVQIKVTKEAEKEEKQEPEKQAKEEPKKSSKETKENKKKDKEVNSQEDLESDLSEYDGEEDEEEDENEDIDLLNSKKDIFKNNKDDYSL